MIDHELCARKVRSRAIILCLRKLSANEKGGKGRSKKESNMEENLNLTSAPIGA